MRTTLIAAGLFALAMTASAAPSDAPPAYAGDVKPAAAAAQPTKKAPAASEEDAGGLAPTASDMRRAREEREKGHVPPKRSRSTKIEAVRDQNNRVTEYVVTPGSTQIPYTMQNRAERPIDTAPGGNNRNTLGTPKFLEFGW